MSLTSELKNPNSEIYRWIDSLFPDGVSDKIIEEHNQILASASIIYPPDQSDLKLVGSAMSHAFYNQLTGNWGLNKPTMAVMGLKKVGRSERVKFTAMAEKAETPYQKALIALVMAYYDGLARGNRQPELKNLLTANVFDRNSLPSAMSEMELQNHPLLYSVWDVANLIDSFHLGWVDGLRSDDIHVNATFAGSGLVGGADAQMISNGILIDIKTSRMKAPFTKKDLYQQLGYWLLDTDNRWNLNEIVWVYPRHQMFLRYNPLSIQRLPYYELSRQLND